MGRCKPTKSNPSGRCGMSMGIYNPFFQNGAPFYGSGNVLITTDSTQHTIDTSSLYTIDRNTQTT